MNDDITPQHDDHTHDGAAADADPKGGPVENPSKLPDWDPESVVAEGLEEPEKE